MTEKVSVVVTVLNEEASINDLLLALKNQTLRPTEVIIVDGGSNDATLQVIKAAARGDHSLKFFQKPGNRSVGRNTGIAQAHHDVIAITDAGCIPHVDWLEELVKAYRVAQKKTDKKIVVAGYYDAQTTTAFTEAVVPYVLVMPDRINPDSFLPATRSMLLDKAAWTAVGGFDELLRDNEDYAFARKLNSWPSVALTFTDQAKVSWLPRTTLQSFWYMIFRFARGDVQAGILRPKVIAIFVRYILLLAFVCYLFSTHSAVLLPVLILFLVIYGYWAIAKNQQYAPRGWYWLPILQVTSDLAVMAGSIAGMFSR